METTTIQVHLMQTGELLVCETHLPMNMVEGITSDADLVNIAIDHIESQGFKCDHFDRAMGSVNVFTGFSDLTEGHAIIAFESFWENHYAE